MRILLTMSLGGGMMALLFAALLPALRSYIRSRELMLLCTLCLLRFVLPLPALFPPESQDIVLREPSAATAKPIPTPAPAAEKPAAAPKAPQAELEKPDRITSSHRSPDKRTLLLLCWAAGTAVVLCRELGGYARYRRKLLSAASPCREEELSLLHTLPSGENMGMVRSPLCPVPMLLGLGHPLIVLPREMDSRELENVLRHELCHKRLRHLPLKWAALFICALHWFNPTVWLLRRVLDQLCELSCDEAVTGEMDAGQKQRYGETLIRLSAAEPSPYCSTAATGSGKKHLKQRLLQIMNGKKSTGRSALLCALCALILCGCGSIVGEQKEEKESVPALLWTEDNNYYSTDGNTWYTSSGNLAYYSIPATNGNAVPVSYATDGNVNPETLDSVKVSTAEELLDAMTFSNHIILESGVYDLRALGPDIHGFSFWKPEGGSHTLYTESTSSLILESESGRAEDVTVLCDYWVWNTATFLQWKGITLKGSIMLFNNYNAYFGSCVFDGGSLTADNCQNLTFQNCLFENGSFNAYFQKLLSLEDCSFVRCQEPSVCQSDNVRFLGCTVDGEPLDIPDLFLRGAAPLIEN